MRWSVGARFERQTLVVVVAREQEGGYILRGASKRPEVNVGRASSANGRETCARAAQRLLATVLHMNARSRHFSYTHSIRQRRMHKFSSSRTPAAMVLRSRSLGRNVTCQGPLHAQQQQHSVVATTTNIALSDGLLCTSLEVASLDNQM